MGGDLGTVSIRRVRKYEKRGGVSQKREGVGTKGWVGNKQELVVLKRGKKKKKLVGDSKKGCEDCTRNEKKGVVALVNEGDGRRGYDTVGLYFEKGTRTRGGGTGKREKTSKRGEFCKKLWLLNLFPIGEGGSKKLVGARAKTVWKQKIRAGSRGCKGGGADYTDLSFRGVVGVV